MEHNSAGCQRSLWTRKASFDSILSTKKIFFIHVTQGATRFLFCIIITSKIQNMLLFIVTLILQSPSRPSLFLYMLGKKKNFISSEHNLSDLSTAHRIVGTFSKSVC